MATGNITVMGSIVDLPSGQKIWSAAITSNAAVDHTITVNLSSGANTIAVPTGAKAAMIIPPSENTETITLKGVTGDTGIPISKTMPTVISFETAPANFVLTAGGTINSCVVAFL